MTFIILNKGVWNYDFINKGVVRKPLNFLERFKLGDFGDSHAKHIQKIVHSNRMYFHKTVYVMYIS